MCEVFQLNDALGEVKLQTRVEENMPEEIGNRAQEYSIL
jgi:hypothetical protein